MSKDFNDERDNEIIVSFAKKPPKNATVARERNVTEEGSNNSNTSSLKEIADEVLDLVSSERVKAEPQRASSSSGEEQIPSSPSSVAPKSVMVLVEGTQRMPSYRISFSTFRSRNYATPSIATLVFSGDPAEGGEEGSAKKFFSLVSAERVADLIETSGHRLRFLFIASFRFQSM